MAFLTVGIDQTYEYFHCGPEATTVHYFFTPTAELTTSTPQSTHGSSMQASISSSQVSATSQSGLMPAQTSTSANAPKSRSRNNTGAIIGEVIGGLSLLGVLALAKIFFLSRHRKRKALSTTKKDLLRQRSSLKVLNTALARRPASSP
ncbi:hypothetical protein F4780DRAFT_545968 [Xylariomycetidae sp. FL0641]|nr:hypothetical protein F4780DRAFT_545968 [Xylariomycetidae sp. FL0641]